MNFKKGFVKLPVALEDWEGFEGLSAGAYGLLLRLFQKVNWRDGIYLRHKVSRGQILTSYQKLAEMINVTKKTVTKIIQELTESGIISVQSYKTAYTLLTLNVYSLADDCETGIPTGVQTGIPTGVNFTPVDSTTGVQTGIPTGVNFTPNNRYKIEDNKTVDNTYAPNGAGADAPCACEGEYCSEQKDTPKPVEQTLLGNATEAKPKSEPKPKREKTQAEIIPPKREWVEAYCAERQNGIDPDAFIAYYESRGWMLSKGVRMKNWQGAVRTWERNRKDSAPVYSHQQQGVLMPTPLTPEQALKFDSWDKVLTEIRCGNEYINPNLTEETMKVIREEFGSWTYLLDNTSRFTRNSFQKRYEQRIGGRYE